jgi:hypothetical protein
MARMGVHGWGFIVRPVNKPSKIKIKNTCRINNLNKRYHKTMLKKSSGYSFKNGNKYKILFDADKIMIWERFLKKFIAKR